ncbi:hypothetical protein B0T17DRAFT_511588 [Bombardia bombarda]|uniref:Uncharacterized protein n=1 Tax=Bombardia bombarda TaxID=252184 RepID=A0AA39WBJ1_9PEZI|nr:hypothetical protein B0T17DRAFT_511588 [Bombardia bombarda]
MATSNFGQQPPAWATDNVTVLHSSSVQLDATQAGQQQQPPACATENVGVTQADLATQSNTGANVNASQPQQPASEPGPPLPPQPPCPFHSRSSSDGGNKSNNSGGSGSKHIGGDWDKIGDKDLSYDEAVRRMKTKRDNRVQNAAIDEMDDMFKSSWKSSAEKGKSSDKEKK